MTPLRTGTYNCEHGHPEKVHAEMILWKFEELALDVLGLDEARDYLDLVEDLAASAGHQVVCFHTDEQDRGGDQVAFLVRGGHTVSTAWIFKAGIGWHRRGGGRMAPMHVLAAVVDGDLLMQGHAPVGAWTTGGWRGRRFVGPLLRRIAYRGFVRRVRRAFDLHRDLRVIFWMDANATPDTRGRWSPEWLREQVGGQFARPHKNTGHGEIDFAITRGFTTVVCDLMPDPDAFPDGRPMPRSDHKLVYADHV